MVTEQTAVVRATRRDWMGLAIIALPCLIYSMDLNVLHLALPRLSADLQPSATQLLWIVDIYGFFVAGLLITMGTLGDRIGRRRLLVAGGGAFGLASVLAAFSTSAEMLIVSRALLGIAGATLAPSTLSLIRNMFLEPRQRTVAIGVWASCFAAGNTLGPMVGGLMLEQFWWGSVFLLAVPVMVMLVVLAPVLLPEFRNPAGGPLDLLSMATATAAVLTIIYGVKRFVVYGADLRAIVAVLVGCALCMFFASRQKRMAQPMIELTLFHNRSFSVALWANIISVTAASGAFLFATQYLQIVAGISPLEAGLWLAPMGIVHLIAAMLTPKLTRCFEPRTVLIAGFAISGLGYALQMLVSTAESTWLLMSGVALFYAGLATMLTMTTDLVLSAVPPSKAGAASGLSETSAELGAALGIALLGSLAAAIYDIRMQAVTLDGVPADAVTGTVGAALVAAQELSGTAGATALKAIRAAFTESMHVVTLASLALSIVGATVCARFLRSGEASVEVGGDVVEKIRQQRA